MRRKYPAIAKALARRADVYNDTIKYIKEREAASSLFVIRPPEKLEIDRIERNPEKLKRVYMVGRKEAKKVLPSLKKYLS